MIFSRIFSALRSLLHGSSRRRDSAPVALPPPPSAPAGDTLRAHGAVWTLTGPDTGSVSLLGGTFAGMKNLIDMDGGTLRATGATWVLTGPNTGSVTNLSGTFAGMTTLISTEPDERKD